MMYPKKPPKQQLEEKEQKLLLKQQQREELRYQMSLKLQKKYGTNNPEIISKEVNNLIDGERKLTNENLQELENNIKRQMLKEEEGLSQRDAQIFRDSNKQQTTGGGKPEDEVSIKSGFSKMSGASNFDVVDKTRRKNEEQSKTGAKAEEHQLDKAAISIIPPAQENEFGFLSEKNQWAAMMKYDSYLFKKEEDLKKLRELRERKKFQQDLEFQLQEKQKRKMKEKMEEDAYVEKLKEQVKKEEARERKQLEEIKAKVVSEKETRDRQMKEILARRKFEEKKEKTMDAYFLKKIKEELAAEEAYNAFKKTHQGKVMKKMLLDNNEKQEKARQERELERLENIKQQEAYCRLIEEQEKKREDAQRERDMKANEFLKQALSHNTKDITDKHTKYEQRLKKYEDRRERELDQREAENKKRLLKMKEETKDYLFKQMDEKKDRLMQEKVSSQEQADMWKSDRESFFAFENAKEQKKRDMLRSYNELLKDQIKDRDGKRKFESNLMSENEKLLNKKVQDDMDNLRKQKLDILEGKD